MCGVEIACHVAVAVVVSVAVAARFAVITVELWLRLQRVCARVAHLFALRWPDHRPASPGIGA